MDYTIEDVKRDLRRLKVNDLDPETEARLMEVFRRVKREEQRRPVRRFKCRSLSVVADSESL